MGVHEKGELRDNKVWTFGVPQVALANNEVVYIGIRTTSACRLENRRILVDNVDAILTFYDGQVFTGGTPIPIKNRNLRVGSATLTPPAFAFFEPAVTPNEANIFAQASYKTGAKVAVDDVTRPEYEAIFLKEETDYVIAIAPATGNGTSSVAITIVSELEPAPL